MQAILKSIEGRRKVLGCSLSDDIQLYTFAQFRISLPCPSTPEATNNLISIL